MSERAVLAREIWEFRRLLWQNLPSGPVTTTRLAYNTIKKEKGRDAVKIGIIRIGGRTEALACSKERFWHIHWWHEAGEIDLWHLYTCRCGARKALTFSHPHPTPSWLKGAS